MHRMDVRSSGNAAVPDCNAPLAVTTMPAIDPVRRKLAASVCALVMGVASASGGSTIEVWVELTEPPPDPAAGPTEMARQRQRVADQQAAVGRALARIGAVELARVRNSGNAIAVRIDKSRVDDLRSVDGVKRVRPARTLHPPKQVP
jgi:hypothetical protein